MTINEITFSRRGVLAAIGGLVVAAAYPPKLLNAETLDSLASDAVDPGPFIRVGPDDIVTVVVKHVELGQGPYTGLSTLVAEELDADWDQVRAISAPVDAALYGNSRMGGMQATGGSSAIASSFDLMRHAGATARAMLVQAAADKWGSDPRDIKVEKGVISLPGTAYSGRFGEFADAAAKLAIPATVTLKTSDTFTLIGRDHAVKRLDTAQKINGSARYTIDVQEPDMLTVVVARSPRFGGKPATVDAEAALKVKGVVAVKPISNGYAVYATGMWPAIKGREALTVTWNNDGAETRGSEELISDFLEATTTTGAIAATRGDIDAALQGADDVVEETYVFPYLAHAPMEPLDGYLKWDETGATARFGCQLQTLDVAAMANVLGLDADKVALETMIAGGSFGRRGTTDMQFANELAEVAKAMGPGTAVKLVWTREDDIQGGYYRPLFVHRLRGVVTDGKITAWSNSIAGQSFIAGTPFGAGMQDNLDPLMSEGSRDLPYSIANFRCDTHMMLSAVPTSAWRSVGHSHTGYAVECFIDQLLRKSGQDAVAGRLELMGENPRAMGVLKAVAELANWTGPDAENGRARGVAVVQAFGTWVAQIAEVSVEGGQEPVVHKVWCAVDCGVAVNPDIIRAQMEGGIAYGVGHALYAEVPLEAGAPTVSNFHDYRALTIYEMPDIEVVIVPSAEQPTGVGEPGVPSAGPAIANAIAHLVGSAPNRLPIVPTS